MKKTLFVKFLFLLLCGSVLTTAGCKDYDDDIDALRNDVEDLKGAVVELRGQAAHGAGTRAGFIGQPPTCRQLRLACRHEGWPCRGCWSAAMTAGLAILAELALQASDLLAGADRPPTH